EPIARRPVVRRLATKDWPSLQPTTRFATAPVSSSVESVSRYHKHVIAITGNTAMAPSPATDGCCRPRRDSGRIVDFRSNNPPMIRATIAPVSGVRDINDAVDESECRPLVLHQ